MKGVPAVMIACPRCKTRYQIKDDLHVERVRCKQCQEVIVVKDAVVHDSSAAKTVVPGAPLAAGAAKTVPPGQAHPTDPAKTMAPGKPAESAAAKTVVPGKPAQPPKPPTTAGAEARTRITGERAAGRPAPSSAPGSAVAESTEADPLIGTTLGGYQVLRKLGQGGMGAVYEARQIALDRSVALKVLPSALAANKSFILRFTREALSVAKLNHNNIIQIYDVGKEGETYFFAMEFVRGMTLQKLVEKEGKLAIDTAVGYVIQAARGLEYAHRKNIVHRDIKPDNIMINEEGVAKVADLGLAKDVTDADSSVTMSGVGMGTPHYMAPEQATDAKTVDARADIYALGCTLYHLATGRVPYAGSSAYEIITKHVNEPVTLPNLVNPDVPAELSEIIVKMMGKKKEDRYFSMEEAIRALEGYLGVDFARTGFHPSEAQIQTLKALADKARAARTSVPARCVVLGLSALTALLIVIGLFGNLGLLVGAIGFALVTPLTYSVVRGIGRKTYLYRRVRSVIFGAPLADWVVVVVLVVVALALILLLKLVGPAILALVLGVAAGAGYYFGFKRPVLKHQDAALEDIARFARELRRKGIPEEEIHLFVCRNAGPDGEHLCEGLFGREALVHARTRLTEEELVKRPFGVRMREWLVRRLDAVEDKRALGKQVVRPVAESAQIAVEQQAEVAAQRTAVIVMPTADAGSAVHAHAVSNVPRVATVIAEKYLDQLDQKPNPIKGLISDLPGFILGRKGRIVVGSVLLLLAILAIRKTVFGDNRVLASYNFALLAFAIILSGFTKSKVFLGTIVLCCVAVIAPFFISNADSVFGQSIAQVAVNVPVAGKSLAAIEKGVGPDAMKNITPPFIVGAFLLLVGFIGQFIWGDW